VALQILLIHHCYGRSGTGTPRPLDGATSKKQTRGPLRSECPSTLWDAPCTKRSWPVCPAFTGDDQHQARTPAPGKRPHHPARRRPLAVR
jgi:CRISPR system Cascade subunit CasA